ncbi:yjeF-like protein, hydroxyethylthiazole kinase-related protein [Aequorivita sublithincola DSM 14238]|uniref:Bifunctional NAD(P)H-hydrate repair enzyme n=1 Tax=Aequorivita sublithincola (strain DSM 14238 / LMG 21431 / ACAM 643 / 9-3) TaxID=746697 RepID=I3YYJ0_AEQSU|nr:bifunctional ADP-dependent NAD(P)H-hydrate dehydratase/NAD(P)H-hydrate epimerase [Aequorivita sublithincola]AFL82058.1 yjeF-like protein, hydroxyethylthiazole kinase-related protein [Aequorivita sublithincola DSM 14238]
MKIFSSEQLYEADKITTEKQQITSEELMERAGTQIFQWLHQRLQGAPVPIHIFCGIGDNGGDGLVVGRLLIEQGYNVIVYVVNCSDKRSENFLHNYDKIKNVTKKWPILMTSEDDFPEINPEEIIVDAIFGIGLNRCPDGWVKELIQYINKRKAFKLAIDIPSGLYSNSPLEDKEAVLSANHTLTFQAPKLSFFLPETAPFVSNFDVLDIGLDLEFLHKSEPLAHLISKPEAQRFYQPREKFGHKGTYGHALLVAGSYGKIGAAVLSTKAAFRIGAGLVTAFVPKCGYPILQTAIPEAMVITDKNEEYISSIEVDFEPSAIGVGMGLGKNKATVEALKKLFTNTESPFVIDADALNNISKNKELLKLLPKNSVLTPHPGELKGLIGIWKNDYDKIEKVKKFSSKHEVVVIIKGAYTLTVYGDKLYLNSSGNPGMATAGSGDALTGVITGLLSQGYDPLLASVFGVYIHGRAGDIAAGQMGYEALMAGDIIEFLADAYIDLFNNTKNDEPYEK